MTEAPREFLEMVENDIQRINDVVNGGTREQQWSLFRELDGRYQACVMHWYRGMWESSKDGTILYFNMLKNQPEYIVDNLKFARSKLETFRYQMNAITLPQIPSTSVTVTNNNTVTVGITFEEARQKIDDMTALNNAQANEIKEKINELEAISKEDLIIEGIKSGFLGWKLCLVIGIVIPIISAS